MTKVWATRSAMMFFVDSLWGYVQMDVLASEFHKLQAVVTATAGADAESGDFEAIQKGHREFLDTCLKSLFLEDGGGAGGKEGSGGAVGGMKKFVGGSLKSCLGTCDLFAGIVRNRLGRGGAGMDGEDVRKLWDEISKVKEDFDQHSSFLFRILSGVQDTARKSHHLDALLLRLDHNLFYSMSS
ncbi:UNVERIFIED_CONTAM: Gamma-tubulin complex component 4, partial [Siphonaria sp. JEL0065]